MSNSIMPCISEILTEAIRRRKAAKAGGFKSQMANHFAMRTLLNTINKEEVKAAPLKECTNN